MRLLQGLHAFAVLVDRLCHSEGAAKAWHPALAIDCCRSVLSSGGHDMRRLVPLIVLLVAPGFSAGDGAGSKYAPAIRALDQWLEKEVTLKKLPSLSIALVDDQE